VGGLVAALVLLGCSENRKPGSITSEAAGDQTQVHFAPSQEQNSVP